MPSIIYGIFGLAIFVRLLGLGPVLFSGAATLALVILPLVIIASIEALKAVPQAQREGAYALGASQWQMVRGSVLPAAAPGIMTGIILAMARAIGEAAPLVVIGAATFVTSLPQPFQGGFTVLPIQVFNWAQRPQADFQGIAAAAIIVILVLIFILNLLALDRAGPPLEAHPVVEESPVNAQAGSTLDATARRPRPPRPPIPTIRIATDPTGGGSASATARVPNEVVVELRGVSCYYGSFRAVKDVSVDRRQARGHRPHRPVGLRQDRRCSGPSTG